MDSTLSDLKIGVIGTGGRGGVARHAHKPDYGSRIVACCDLVDSSLGSAKDRYGSGLYTTHDYRDLLDRELDAVFITTPDYLHEEHAIAALEAGVAVYLEKPMAITIIFGLLGSTIIVLVLVPVLLVIQDDITFQLSRIRNIFNHRHRKSIS